MSEVWKYRLLFALICTVILFMRMLNIRGSSDEENKYTSDAFLYGYGCVLPPYILILAIAELIINDSHAAINRIITLCANAFLTTSIYYSLLLPLLPLLRRKISAKACALLWLIPNFLYLMERSIIREITPLVIIPIGNNSMWFLLVIWLLGFIGILAWRIFGHIIFYRNLIDSSMPITEDRILAIWNLEKESAGVSDKNYKLLRNKDIRTPLSIGFTEKTICCVLPEKEYSPQELHLIFCHELAHLCHGDYLTKLFMTICTAMCWFNPLMWIAMERSAEDLELSCDEDVLRGADTETKKLYARLLLNTAGESRGFTTCLASTAKSLRHRMQCILAPAKKAWGGIIVSVIFFSLCMFYGTICLAYDRHPASEVLFPTESSESHILQTVSVPENVNYSETVCIDPGQLMEYLGSLEVRRLTGAVPLKNEELFYAYFSSTNHSFIIRMNDRYLVYIPIKQQNSNKSTYLLTSPPDWDHIYSLIEMYPAMTVLHTDSNSGQTESMKAKLYDLSRIQGDAAEHIRNKVSATPSSTMYNTTFMDVQLEFSHELIGEYTVTVENWNKTESYTLRQNHLSDNILPLAPYDAHYTVSAQLQGKDQTIYHAQFQFNVMAPGGAK